jgi:hypothetical protein
MAVARAAAWDANNFNEPTGTVPPEAGSDRLLVVMQLGKLNGGFTVSTFTIGGQTFDEEHEILVDDGVSDVYVKFYVWKEAKIAAMSGSTISYTDDATQSNTMFTYATFTGVDQTTPTTFTTYGSTSTDSATLTTTSTANDYIVIGTARNPLARDVTDWDTLTELFDTGSADFRQAAADGAGGDNSSVLTGDGTAGSWAAGALVIHAVSTSVPVFLHHFRQLEA